MSTQEEQGWLKRLNEAYDGAEVGTPKKGDLVIVRDSDREFAEVFLAAHDFVNDQDGVVRILERAKPAWHSAIAVLASVDDPTGPEVADRIGRIVLIPTLEPGVWQSADSGVWYSADDLTNVTPLIPAEVTGDMAVRYLNYSRQPEDVRDWSLDEYKSSPIEDAQAHLAVVLGLEAQ